MWICTQPDSVGMLQQHVLWQGVTPDGGVLLDSKHARKPARPCMLTMLAGGEGATS